MRNEYRLRVRRRIAFAFSLLLAGSLVLIPHPAAAGFFDFLFGGGSRNGPSAPAAPNGNPLSTLFGMDQPAPSAPAASGGGGGTVYCVRLCDGRHFPIQRSAGSPTQLCQAFCPATATKIFTGGAIERAVAHDGTRYAGLPNAFVYRERVVPGCSCNGRDAFGLASVDIASDQTLKSGDVVATNSGLVVYSSPGGRNAAGGFTPVSAYAGLTDEVRAKLAEIKVSPAVTDADEARAIMTPHDKQTASPAAAAATAPKPAATAKSRNAADAQLAPRAERALIPVVARADPRRKPAPDRAPSAPQTLAERWAPIAH